MSKVDSPARMNFTKAESESHDTQSNLEMKFFSLVAENKKSYSDLDYDNSEFEHNKPDTEESYYFRKLYSNFYGENNAKLLPNMWRPLWTDETDPSATLLKSHSKDK